MLVYQYNDIVENSNGKIGEKKAKGIIYDKMLEHFAIIREKKWVYNFQKSPVAL